MTTLAKYNLDGKKIGDVKADALFDDAQINGQMLKDYIVGLRANARQWSANTKGRSEVNHSNKKPHPQKGTGRARQGRLSSPQYKGGGRVFGPKPKFDQHVRINAKERRAVIRHLIAEKIKDNRLHILESTTLETPKTQTVANFLQACSIKGRVLFLGDSKKEKIEDQKDVTVHCNKHHNFAKSVSNLQKTQFALASNISGYDVLIAKDLVLTEEALKELTQWLTISKRDNQK